MIKISNTKLTKDNIKKPYNFLVSSKLTKNKTGFTVNVPQIIINKFNLTSKDKFYWDIEGDHIIIYVKDGSKEN